MFLFVPLLGLYFCFDTFFFKNWLLFHSLSLCTTVGICYVYMYSNRCIIHKTEYFQFFIYSALGKVCLMLSSIIEVSYLYLFEYKGI